MAGHLMNPVNRQYFERANLVGQRGLIGTLGSKRAAGRRFFRESQPGFIRHQAISHYFGHQ